MPAPLVVAVAPGSPGARAGMQVGDEVVTVNGEVPRDIIAWRLLADGPDLELEVRRGGLAVTLAATKRTGEPLGVDVQSAVFDAVRTCDNHCEFCFIYQLPKGMRKSLYLKDDDYRLSFLYGNFTTLTRFTEADLERVVVDGLSPLNVSIHATDPEIRAGLLRNRRGATSLRWLRALLDHGVTVHGQIVVCPGVNDGDVLDDTMAGVLDRYPELASLCVVPLGVSRFNTEERMRPHTTVEAAHVLDVVGDWQGVFSAVLGRRLVHAADEYYLLTGRPFPPAADYDGFPMHEDGVGMARTFEREFLGEVDEVTGPQRGFFAAADRTPPNPSAYTALRAGPAVTTVPPPVRREAAVGILTAPYGVAVLAPLIDSLDRPDVRLVPVVNDFFGGNIAVTGLMVGADLARTLAAQPGADRYLLPDVCITEGRFLDGVTPAELPRPVEIVPTDGRALRRALERR